MGKLRADRELEAEIRRCVSGRLREAIGENRFDTGRSIAEGQGIGRRYVTASTQLAH